MPNPWRMIQMGYGGLYRYMKRHPNAFKKFKFAKAIGVDKKGENRQTYNCGIREEHKQTALELSKTHDGIPDASWLNANGYSRLAAYIRAYPAVFKGLNKTKFSKKRF
ncbi:MAG: hypothetical protein ACXAC5_01680 [Promethearchaeota archaeon]